MFHSKIYKYDELTQVERYLIFPIDVTLKGKIKVNQENQQEISYRNRHWNIVLLAMQIKHGYVIIFVMTNWSRRPKTQCEKCTFYVDGIKDKKEIGNAVK